MIPYTPNPMAPEKSVTLPEECSLFMKSTRSERIPGVFRLISQGKLTNSVFPVRITVTPQGAEHCHNTDRRLAASPA